MRRPREDGATVQRVRVRSLAAFFVAVVYGYSLVKRTFQSFLIRPISAIITCAYKRKTSKGRAHKMTFALLPAVDRITEKAITAFLVRGVHLVYSFLLVVL